MICFLSLQSLPFLLAPHGRCKVRKRHLCLECWQDGMQNVDLGVEIWKTSFTIMQMEKELVSATWNWELGADPAVHPLLGNKESRGESKTKGNQPRIWNSTAESFQKAGWSPVPNNTERFKMKEVKTTQEKRIYLCLWILTTFRCRLQLQILHCHDSWLWVSFSVHACCSVVSNSLWPHGL